jgi:hypothetical protein
MRFLAASYVTVGDRLRKTFEESATEEEFEQKAKKDPEGFWEDGNEALTNLMVQMRLYSSALEKLEHGKTDQEVSKWIEHHTEEKPTYNPSLWKWIAGKLKGIWKAIVQVVNAVLKRIASALNLKLERLTLAFEASIRPASVKIELVPA